MTRVFLSYAEEDEAVARSLVDRYVGSGVEFYWWQDDEQRGRRFVGEIERGILSADLFVVLMSPNYLASSWCRRERDLAIQRETDLGHHQLIYVLKVAETRYATSGFLSGYDWLDLTSQDEQALAVVDAALPLTRALPAHPTGATPVFRNREDELNEVVHHLTTTAGRDLWLILSPPKMGKSWLLDQLEKELRGRVANCLVRLLDLREYPSDLRIDPARLLGTLLDVDGLIDPGAAVDTRAVQRTIAAELSQRKRPQLYLLDSADLLDAACAAQVRSALTGIYQWLRLTGTTHSRLSVIIGSRRHDDWKRLDPASGLRFHTVELTEFSEDVVYQALSELGHNLGAEKQRDCAKRLHRLSEGLPALLIRSLHWVEKTAFLDMSKSDRKATFDAVARPYIRDDLLSISSLVPSGGDDLSLAMRLLESALKKLVPYRLLTQSHVSFHVDNDPDFGKALRDAKWSLDDLWRALGRTALLKRLPEEPWQVIHPPIRRLLYRYYYGSEDARHQAHTTARQFYRGWTGEHNAGMEQGVVLVECLWHETARMMAERPPRGRKSRVRKLLPDVAAELATEFAKSPFYRPVEFSEFVANRINADEEFQLLLREYGGLFDGIRKSVVETIHGSA
jgi:hypothetical protein